MHEERKHNEGGSKSKQRKKAGRRETESERLRDPDPIGRSRVGEKRRKGAELKELGAFSFFLSSLGRGASTPLSLSFSPSATATNHGARDRCCRDQPIRSQQRFRSPPSSSQRQAARAAAASRPRSPPPPLPPRQIGGQFFCCFYSSQATLAQKIEGGQEGSSRPPLPGPRDEMLMRGPRDRRPSSNSNGMKRY